MEKSLIDSKRDEMFMRMALQEAAIAYEEGEIPVGAVVVYKDKVIARSHNQTELLNDCTAHAEMLCITSAMNYCGAKYLNDCVLYVTLEPCVMCAGALFWSQIGRVVYAASDRKRGYSKIGEILHPSTVVESGLLKEESEQLLKSFFSSLRDLNP